ncbi:hypothetical protein HUJ04_012820 [Dendroctonus ponderosae]|uniref:Conserved oligomeric Golgi complex subunit 2 n=2 Tax=Dendroctonus ponderosae TaxID=77166 RepID=A0AAR5PWG8_DENPD|nr:hypothetical protein HUJ04_012820 [Dendroctonus ponderosae]
MDPEDLHIWKEAFFKGTFSVDESLTEYTQKFDLDTLKKDLKKYGAELQLHMSDILKNETEAIVNLAENLTNLNSRIDNLSIPINQLREEIRALYDLIKKAKSGYELILGDIKRNHSKQNHIHLKLGILNSTVYIDVVITLIEASVVGNLLTLERIVNKYSFEKIYLDELDLMTPDIEKVVKNVEHKLLSNLNNCFLKAVKDNDENILLRCLRMYVDLQLQDEAHDIFKTHIIKPALQSFLSERYLEKCGQDLNEVYINIKQILDTTVERVIKIVKDNSELNSFSFLLKSFWKEFDLQSRAGLPHITAPGNPELFQKRFTSTYNLLMYIAAKADNKDLVRLDESFQAHLKRFNLPVYFEIKFQQIAGKFESDTLHFTLDNITADLSRHSFKLKLTEIMWNAIVCCFQEDTYIDQLADQFIRLSMLLLSRYAEHIMKLLNHIIASAAFKDTIDVFIISVLIDLNMADSLLALKCERSVDVEKTTFAIVNKGMWKVLIRVFKANGQVISHVRNAYANHLTNLKVNACVSQLQSVTAIPRLYRRTNRSPPKEASAYMMEALQPILKFSNQFISDLHQFGDILNQIIVEIANKYLSLVREVLMSVCKTEESLRRLKNRTLNSSEEDSTQASPNTVSDEAKIREQIRYDVEYFCEKLQPLASKTTRNEMAVLKAEICK